MIGAFLLSAMCGLMVIGSYAAFAKTLGEDGKLIYVIGTADFVLIGSLAALFNGAGRIVWGRIADVINFRKTMMLMFTVQAILMFFYFTTNFNAIYFMVITCLIYFALVETYRYFLLEPVIYSEKIIWGAITV